MEIAAIVFLYVAGLPMALHWTMIESNATGVLWLRGIFWPVVVPVLIAKHVIFGFED